MSEIQTIKIRIWGIVQGVGFRPFVAKLADRYDMKGEVLNIGGLVDIVVTDTLEKMDAFMEALKREKPLPAEIVHIKMEKQDYRHFDSFKILESDDGDDEAAMIPADLSICPDCLEELMDENNPRYMHPFISCMVCGPRYTIIDKIPYDRDNTAMIDFPMCNFCEGEYTNRNDRRYHAQTISCHDCGPILNYKLPESNGKEAASVGIIGFKGNDQIQKKVIVPVAWYMLSILRGGVIAFKSVGGYNFVCSPFREDAVKKLRQIKEREEKPFAVMFKDIEQIKEYCYISENEEKLLKSSAKPIVLLERKSHDENSGEKIICEEVYKTSRYIGAFLPSMGAQYILIDKCGPLIMTSANLSDMPIIKDDEEMFALQVQGLEGIFYNERKIRIRLDDSVVRVIDGQPQMIRRSKGYAPVPLYINNGLTKNDMVLATGGQLKSAFSLSKGPFAYVSQYFGDLDRKEACDIYAENIERMQDLFRIKPKLIVSDLHPSYFTTKYAEKYSERHSVQLLKVQHHHAHVASVIAEHDLKGPVIGVSFDGAIWGGEFLICDGTKFERAAHLEYIKMIGGDSSIKEGWKSAMSYIYSNTRPAESMDNTEYNEYDYNRMLNDSRYPLVKAALVHNINTIDSSSMGRLFDAVAAFTGIHDTNHYEGECAIMLENAAAEALRSGLEPLNMNFEMIEKDPVILSSKQIFKKIGKALEVGIQKEQIALGFHYAVSELILEVCNRIRSNKGINQVTLTGGVFQNKILMEKTLELLRSVGYQVYYNISVGPNDGGICLGQNYLGMKYLAEMKINS